MARKPRPRLVEVQLIEVDGVAVGPAEEPRAEARAGARPGSASLLAALALVAVLVSLWALPEDGDAIRRDQAGFDELGDLDLALRAVVTPTDGSRASLVVADGSGSAGSKPLPALAGWSFDSSGRWLAGLGSTVRNEARTTLLAAEAGGVLEPVAGEVETFAWHDTRPGLVAWVDPEGLIRMLDLEASRGPVDVDGAGFRGEILGWGEWGFALQAPGAPGSTTVIGPGGSLLGELEGRFASYVPGTGVVLSRGAAAPVAFDPSTAATSAVTRMRSGDLEWRVEATGSLTKTVALVDRPDTASLESGEVVVVRLGGQDVVARIVSGSDTGPTGDGRLVVADPRSLAGVWGWSLVHVDTEGQVRRVPMPDVAAGREWLPALAGDAMVLLGGVGSG